jgi:glutathione S-transferase
MMTLYSALPSGNVHKVRMLLDALKLPYTERFVDMAAGENKQPWFLALNPLGQIPVLTDGDVTIADSQAILVYLARKYGNDSWLPRDPVGEAEVQRWLIFAGYEIANSLMTQRAIHRMKRNYDPVLAAARVARVLKIMEDHLTRHDWLALGRPTIADLACYPYVYLSPEGKVDLGPFPRVRAWMERVGKIPNIEPMAHQIKVPA